jgi:membrane protease YdiL (CAAX protease family)
LLRGIPWRELRRGLGWHAGKGWHIEIPLGIAGYFAGMPILVTGMAITYWLIKKGQTMPSHPILSEAANHSPLQILLLYSIASIWAPVIEETMFRGALFHHLRGRWGWLISSMVVAFLFAIIHPQGWSTVPALMAIAIVLAALREWRGSILAPMAAHAFHNGVLITLLLLMS